MIKKDKSYGIIPVRKSNESFEVLLVQHHKGHWSMPKGHPEEGETPVDTAKRELFEETGLEVVVLYEAHVFQERYQFKYGALLVDKTVEYYLAEVSGTLKVQQEEVKQASWLSFVEAEKIATFQEARSLLNKVKQVLLDLSN